MDNSIEQKEKNNLKKSCNNNSNEYKIMSTTENGKVIKSK